MRAPCAMLNICNRVTSRVNRDHGAFAFESLIFVALVCFCGVFNCRFQVQMIPSFFPFRFCALAARETGREERGWVGGSVPRAAAGTSAPLRRHMPAALPWAGILLPLQGAGRAASKFVFARTRPQAQATPMAVADSLALDRMTKSAVTLLLQLGRPWRAPRHRSAFRWADA
jgi:hypothetical protein